MRVRDGYLSRCVPQAIKRWVRILPERMNLFSKIKYCKQHRLAWLWRPVPSRRPRQSTLGSKLHHLKFSRELQTKAYRNIHAVHDGTNNKHTSDGRRS
jgi:hypothetical protein